MDVEGGIIGDPRVIGPIRSPSRSKNRASSTGGAALICTPEFACFLSSFCSSFSSEAGAGTWRLIGPNTRSFCREKSLARAKDGFKLQGLSLGSPPAATF
eukprot:scaffold116_cov233-Pinguiococcus_pyrenoidosus.AAC.11